jgi:type I restriction enzyme S subunit
MVKNAKHPIDWGLVTIKEICKSLNYGTSKKSTFSGKCAVLRMGNLQNGYIDWTDLVFTNDEKDIQKYSLVKGDVLFNRTNSADLVGKTSLYRGEYPAIYAGYLIKLNYDRKKVVGEYLNYILNTQEAKEYCLAVKTDGVSQSNINAQKIGAFLFHLPPFEEQKKISEFLSDVDNLIFSLQKLIEKKKAIKQGAMQQLLTGKKRLPGFSGEWEKISLGDVLNYEQPTDYIVKSTEYTKTGIPVLTAGKTAVLGYTQEKDGVYHKLPVILFDDFLTVSKYIDFQFKVKSSAVKMLSLKRVTDNLKVIYELMQMIAFSVADHQRHWISKFSKFDIYLPLANEQQAIAQVLSDMDSEIEQLEKKLSKYQQIRQGMMQELLSGRIRLVDTDGKERSKPKAIQEKQPKPAHNQHFDDAVMIAGIVNAFYSEKYPLGRKKVQKLLYLVRRKEQADISAFHKKAAGPYADEVRYKGGEPIAQKNKYIQVKGNEKGSCFEKGVQMQQALTYLQEWGKQADIDWLVSQFQYTGINELELLATVDMAICDLRREGKGISVVSIKDLIRSNKEWRDKLKKAYFKDADLQRAIKRCQELFSGKEG